MKFSVNLLALLCLALLGAGCPAVQPSVPLATPHTSLYWDNSQPVEARIDNLLDQMTTAEKIGQLALVEKNSVRHSEDIADYSLGGLLSGGGIKPDDNSPQGWLEMVNGFQSSALQSRLGIPILYGVDAVHGHTNVPGATVFPQNIALGATRDPDLVRQIGAITAQEMAATGIYWNYSPSIDVVRDTRWGRTYESFGSDYKLVSELGAAYLEGLESDSTHVIGTAKHYLGAGAMVWGTSTNRDFKIDQGAIQEDEETLRAVDLPPFTAAIKAGVSSIMVGHATWNGTELVASHYLLTDVLKNELGFNGFVVSDWFGVYEIPGDKYHAVVTAINAGVDMVMLPYDYKSFTGYMSQALATGDITQERLDDAVRRILRAKFTAGLFDAPLADGSALGELGSEAHRAVAREAVRKSQVLLKNSASILPLSKTLSHVVIAGSSADNLGRQSGGWTVEWQGVDGNDLFTGTTVLAAVQQTVSAKTIVDYDPDGDFSSTEKADVGIAVVGEAPYAEGWGDNQHPALSATDLQTIAKVKAASKKLVVIIVSGRPLDIAPFVGDWDAVIAAWLPGSEGEGITDVLFGDYPFTGQLPVAWPL